MLAALIASTVVVGGGAAAHAEEGDQPLAAAVTALERGDPAAARHSLDAAIRSGHNRPAKLARYYVWYGRAAAVAGDSAAAADLFRRALAVEPRIRLPAAAPAMARAAFDQARAAGDAAVEVRIEASSRSVVVSVESDPLTMVAGLRMVYRDAGGVTRQVVVPGEGRIVVQVPREARDPVIVAAIDEHANHLVERSFDVVGRGAPPIAQARDEGPDVAPKAEDARVDAPPPAPVVAAAPGDSAHAAPPLYARWTLWGAATLASAAVAVHFGMNATSTWNQLDLVISDSASHSYADARSLERRGRREARIANIGAGSAAVFGAVTAVLLIRGAGERAEGGERRLVSATPLPGGGAVHVAIDF